MFNVERSTVCQMDPERTKRLGVERVAKLFNCHDFVLGRDPMTNKLMEHDHERVTSKCATQINEERKEVYETR